MMLQGVRTATDGQRETQSRLPQPDACTTNFLISAVAALPRE
jgi:hypothetical protein